MCAFVASGLVFPYQAKRLAWGTSRKWPIYCRVGQNHNSSNQAWAIYRLDVAQPTVSEHLCKFKLDLIQWISSYTIITTTQPATRVNLFSPLVFTHFITKASWSSLSVCHCHLASKSDL